MSSSSVMCTDIHIDINVSTSGNPTGSSIPQDHGGSWSARWVLGTGWTQALRRLMEAALGKILSSFLTPERTFLFQELWTLLGTGAAWGEQEAVKIRGKRS